MNRKPQGVGGTASRPSASGLGFTLSETIIVDFLISIVTAIAVTSVRHSIERARMASCMMELRGIHAALWHDIGARKDHLEPYRRRNLLCRWFQSPLLNSCRVDSDRALRRLEADCGP